MADKEKRVFTPYLDILERDDDFIVTADVPGADPKGVEVSLENDMLTVRVPVIEPEVGDLPLLVREYNTGDFETVLRISEGVNRDKVTAELKDGVLTLTLPKAEEVKPKKIAVKAA